jgi:hypothetical protein
MITGKLKHGERINIKKVYRAYNKGDEKIWKQIDSSHDNCIFLGYRTIKNGKTHYDDECGNYFVPSEHLSVMLISINTKENPIYSPIPIKEEHEKSKTA